MDIRVRLFNRPTVTAGVPTITCRMPERHHTLDLSFWQGLYDTHRMSVGAGAEIRHVGRGAYVLGEGIASMLIFIPVEDAAVYEVVASWNAWNAWSKTAALSKIDLLDKLVLGLD